MKADLARITYDATRHIRRVLRQQGRVEVEADGNEQTAVLLHHLEAVMRDLVGPDAAPLPEADGGRDGFKVTAEGPSDLRIADGHYWVDGILCENDTPGGVLYSKQADYPVEDKPQPGVHLVYLDVWERHLCADEAPWVREVALGGPDTATRSRLVWQVKVADHLDIAPDPAAVRKDWPRIVERFQAARRGQLRARAVAVRGSADPCVTPPDSRYRGPENQLYRVEVHDPGEAGKGATFVWSRDNGSVVYPVRRLLGSAALVERLPVDLRFALEPGHWVEVVDDTTSLLGTPGRLLEVKRVDDDELEVELVVPSGSPALPAFDEKSTTHPLLRRWDQRSAAIPVEEGVWIDVEDGIQVLFEAPAPANGGRPHRYRSGDYWTIPARVATGDVEWPQEGGQPAARPPQGVLHHYAPLAVATFAAAGGPANVKDTRRRMVKLWKDL
ncbi:MAG: DUF6519 domain-containing protein [Acidimicrobiales bacterium]